MRSAILTVILGSALLSVPLVARQTTEQQVRARFVALIEARLKSGQQVEIRAETITLTGDVLRLKGHAWIWFDDTSFMAEEATINRATQRVQLFGNTQGHLGRN